MQEDNQFHLAVVTQKRRHDQNPEESSAAVATEPHTHHSGEHHMHHGGERHTHHSGEHHSHQGGEHRSHHSGEHRSHHSSDHHTHNRHYQDYGTVELGALRDGDSGVEEPIRDCTPAAPLAPTKGQLQREFYDKYDTLFRRRYENRNRGKVMRIVIIAILSGLIAIAGLILIFNLKGQADEPLKAPEVETVPVVTLDLG